MESTESILLELAADVSHEHNLGIDSMLRLANTLEELNTEANIPYITFPHLVHQLSDTDCAVPDWLAASETKLEEYKASQFNAIVKLVEARYWLGNAQQIFDRLWAWQIVFGQPRHVHRQMMSKSDAQSLASLPGPRGKYSFTTSMPQHYFEDYPDSYKLLRESSFPNGIDDAIPAFIKHYCLLGITVFKLRKRITALYRVGIISRGCKLFTKSQELIVGAESMVKNTMCMAQRWHAASKMQKEYYQLPGVDLGLSYGTKIFTEYDANKAFVVHTPVQGESGQTHWDSVGPLYTPIRWRPGSAWLDYFRNTRQDHPIMRHFDINDLKRDKGIPRDISGPYEMRIPQAIVPIWMHYARMYDGYEDGFNTTNETLSRIAETKDDCIAKRLSSATGEPYWHVREIRIEYGTISMYFPHNPVLVGRPWYDALGNLRLDCMGAILKELKTGISAGDHRTKQSMALLRADCDDDTAMGNDLVGSQ